MTTAKYQELVSKDKHCLICGRTKGEGAVFSVRFKPRYTVRPICNSCIYKRDKREPVPKQERKRLAQDKWRRKINKYMEEHYEGK